MVKRSLSKLLRKVFDAGVRFGSRYPEYDAIPKAEQEIQYLALMAEVRGAPWTPDMWERARRENGLL